jgi:hypothetical protein
LKKDGTNQTVRTALEATKRERTLFVGSRVGSSTLDDPQREAVLRRAFFKKMANRSQE